MSELSILTTQNVNINFRAASVGERMLACLLDFLIKIAYITGVSYVLFGLFNFDIYIDKLDNWSAISIYIIIFSPFLFYSLVLESIFEGQTLGKKILKIKVVKIDGYQASFADYIVRWVFRMVDINLSMGVIGLITTILSSKTQRLGDIVAGTAVIGLKNTISINQTILENLQDNYQPTYPLVIKLSDNDARIIKETFLQARTSGDYETLKKLADKIIEVTGIKKNQSNVAEFIEIVLKDFNYYTQN